VLSIEVHATQMCECLSNIVIASFIIILKCFLIVNFQIVCPLFKYLSMINQ